MQQLPLILLHGALGSTDHWTELVKILMPVHELHSFNFSGHGGNTSDKDYTIDVFVDDLIHYMEQNNIAKANIFGYSMGGYVALKFAMNFPDKIGKIMTLGTKFDWSPEAVTTELAMLKPDLIIEKVPHFAEALTERHKPIDWKDVVTKTANMMRRLSEGEATDFTTSDLPHQIQICVGDLDRVVKFGEAMAVANQLPNATFLPLPDVPHPIEQVDKQMLAKQIHKFMNQVNE